MMVFDRLVAEKIVDSTIVSVLKNYARKWNKSEYEALLECNIFTETSFTDTAARLFQMDRLFRVLEWPDASTLSRFIAYNEAKEQEIFPHRFLSKGEVETLIYDPTKKVAIQSFLSKKGLKAKFVLCEHKEIHRAIDAFYPIEAQLPHLSGLGSKHD